MGTAKTDQRASNDPWLKNFTELAQACDRAEAPAAFPRLRQLLQEALDLGRDDLVDSAAALQREMGLGIAIRELAEQAAEEIEVQHRGSPRAFRLFVVPVILRFDMEVPESRLDWALVRVAPSAVLAPCASNATTAMLPGFFRHDDLREVPLSAVRRGARLMAQATSLREMACVAPIRVVAVPKRRSATFLRYLVGQQAGSDGQLPPETPWPSLDQAVQLALQSALGIDVQIISRFDGRYHSALYRGLWDYQEIRLRQIAAAANRCSPDLHAVVGADPPAKNHTLGLALYARQATAVGAYLLRHRPGEAATASVTRVATRLREAGIANVRCLPPRGVRARPHEWGFPLLPI